MIMFILAEEGETMAYIINDKTLVSELCSDRFKTIVEQEKEKLGIERALVHPLDDNIVGENGLLKKILKNENRFSYSSADKLDGLWKELLDKSIRCLRYFDNREPFAKNEKKAIVAYGIDNLEEYHRKYTEFESLLYGASSYYRDHVFHAVRVWMLGVFCLIKRDAEETDSFYSNLVIDGGSEMPTEWNFFECISMWTIAALCHDLGYPLEKAENILDSTRRMMREFIPNPNIWNNFGYSGTQDSINDYILKFISTKMKHKDGNPDSTKYVGRIQPKYFLKYAKSLENFKHGIISTVIVYKMLLYFLESDFNLNDDYTYSQEDARQFYIRREILRAMAAHTCPDAYNVNIYTFSSLLFICDELQEWGRKTWNELYTGLNEDSVSLRIEAFKPDNVSIVETIDMTAIEDESIIINNICRIFDRQYSLYKTTFRDGQDTARRDFDLTKKMSLKLKQIDSSDSVIDIQYVLPKDKESKFIVDLNNYQTSTKKTAIADQIRKKLSHSLYKDSLTIKTSRNSNKQSE